MASSSNGRTNGSHPLNSSSILLDATKNFMEYCRQVRQLNPMASDAEAVKFTCSQRVDDNNHRGLCEECAEQPYTHTFIPTGFGDATVRTSVSFNALGVVSGDKLEATWKFST